MGIAELSERHLSALLWFEHNAGRVFAKRPFDVGLGLKITDASSGIRKPAGSAYALSCVQTRKGVYPDQAPIVDADGSWSYLYHQEGKTPEDYANPERRSTNAGLLKCREDRVPVGVIIPGPGKSDYLVLGLAMVDDYIAEAGYFVLTGPATVESQQLPIGDTKSSVTLAFISMPTGTFDPASAVDDRQKVIASVVRRQGRGPFRSAMLQAYQGRCAMSAFDAPQALEAAHIMPYRGPQTNHPANGLLLRADLHDLFDLGLIAVDSRSMSLMLAAELLATKYRDLDGRRVEVPKATELHPSREALDEHRARSSVDRTVV